MEVSKVCHYEGICSICGKMFKHPNNEMRARIDLEDHEKYCELPTKYKILKVVLLPLIIITIPVMFIGMFLLLVLCLPLLLISYPFALGCSLSFENKIVGFKYYMGAIDRWVNNLT